jgi:hypothetical protein
MGVEFRYTSHETFCCGRIHGGGCDGERIGNPSVRLRCPHNFHLPEATTGLVEAAQEANRPVGRVS